MKYVCPMHPQVQQNTPGKCPECGMRLVIRGERSPLPSVFAEQVEMGGEMKAENSYVPLIVVVGIICLTTLALTLKDVQSGSFLFNKTIEYFMIGFFLVFSAFKLMDIKGFASGYSMYDLLAKKWYTYGYIYPFVELSFGLAMILGSSKVLLAAELVVMTLSGVGVLLKIAKKEKFQCACLGTFLKVPLTYVTLIEDFGMAILAAILLLS
jgi:hypothetical protein